MSCQSLLRLFVVCEFAPFAYRMGSSSVSSFSTRPSGHKQEKQPGAFELLLLVATQSEDANQKPPEADLACELATLELWCLRSFTNFSDRERPVPSYLFSGVRDL